MTIAIIAAVVLIFVVAIISRLAKGAGGGNSLMAPMMNQAPVPLTDDDRARIVELLRNGKKIDAIKLYRDVTHHHLKEAKEAVEAIERQG